MEIAILGTGAVGRALAGAFTRVGHHVVLGTRDPRATREREGFPADLELATYADAAAGADVAVNATNGDGSLPAVAELFADRWLLLAGWVHYLAFDLLVGRWEAEDAARHGVSPWLATPCLGLTFMFGPIGWLAYLATRRVIAARPPAMLPRE